MKNVVAAIILLFVFTFAVSAFAGNTRANFSNPVVVNGQTLPAGQYILKYEINGKTAEVKIMQKDKTVATTTATVVDNETKSPYDSVVRENNSDGTSTLKEIQIANKKQTIRFEGDTAVGK